MTEEHADSVRDECEKRLLCTMGHFHEFAVTNVSLADGQMTTAYVTVDERDHHGRFDVLEWLSKVIEA